MPVPIKTGDRPLWPGTGAFGQRLPCERMDTRHQKFKRDASVRRPCEAGDKTKPNRGVVRAQEDNFIDVVSALVGPPGEAECGDHGKIGGEPVSATIAGSPIVLTLCPSR